MVHNYSFMQTCLTHMIIKLTPKLHLASKKEIFVLQIAFVCLFLKVNRL